MRLWCIVPLLFLGADRPVIRVPETTVHERLDRLQRQIDRIEQTLQQMNRTQDISELSQKVKQLRNWAIEFDAVYHRNDQLRHAQIRDLANRRMTPGNWIRETSGIQEIRRSSVRTVDSSNRSSGGG